MKKNILFLIIGLVCCYSQIYTISDAQLEATVDDFRNKAEAATTRGEYDQVAADYRKFIISNWPTHKTIPPLPRFQ